MVLLTFRRLSNLLLLILCCSIPITTAMHFLHKDIMMAIILGKILKPRFVPLPIPIPLPFKVVKNTHKPYPVPVYSHSVHAHQVGQQPWSQDLSHKEMSDLSGVHALAQLHSASENIESLVQQLSLSPDVIKESDSNNIHSFDNDVNGYGDFTNFPQSDDWW